LKIITCENKKIAFIFKLQNKKPKAMTKNKRVFMWYKIKELSAQGLNQSQIKLELGIDRGTVRKYLLMNEAQFLEWISTPRRMPKKLNGYYNFVKELLGNAPYLSAAQVEDRLKERYTNLPDVSSKTVYNFVQTVRKEQNIPKYKEKLPRQYEKLAETEYGEEAQVDFGSYRMLSRGSGRVKIYFFTIVLSRSRQKFIYCQRMPFTTETANYAHELAFEYFEGIPRRILYDQDRVFIKDENLGDVLLTEKFMQFTNAHPFEVVFCKKADPESKGKVENVVKYVKHNYLKGRVFQDIDTLQKEALLWLERTGNAKVHGTTKRIPKEEWEKEKQHLLPYNGKPEKPFLKLPTHPVRKDNTVLYRSNYYSVPLGTYQDRDTKILLEEKDEKLFFYTGDNQLLATHDLCLDIGRIIKNNDHAREKSKTMQKTYELVLESLRHIPKAEQYLAEIENNKPRNFHDNLRVMQKNIERSSAEAINLALVYCYENKILNANRFAEVLNYFEKEQGLENVKHSISIEIGRLNEFRNDNMQLQKSDINEYESIMN
jgi:transposase